MLYQQLQHQKKIQTLTGTEWELAEACVAILKPFKVATAELSAFKYPSISMIIPTLNKLKYHLTLDSDTFTCLQILKEHLVSNIDKRWPNYESIVTYAIATLVDPRYKDCAFEDPEAVAEARRMVLREMSSHSEQLSTRSSTGSTHQATCDAQDNGAEGI